MKIGELAKLTQTQAETIRFYEREGLINEPPRTDGNYRLYGLEHLARLGFIRSCRSLDMTLAEIRTLLQFKDAPEENCEQVNALLDEHIGHAATRIKELKILQKDLKALREQCTTDRIASECGILNHLEEAARLTPEQNIDRNHSVHVHGVHQRVGSAARIKSKARNSYKRVNGATDA